MHESTLETICSYKGCLKKFEARKCRFNEKSKFKPKYCSSECYAKARTLPPEVLLEHRRAKSKKYYHEVIKKKKKGEPAVAPPEETTLTPEQLARKLRRDFCYSY